jgi:hypothetical protein
MKSEDVFAWVGSTRLRSLFERVRRRNEQRNVHTISRFISRPINMPIEQDAPFWRVVAPLLMLM